MMTITKYGTSNIPLLYSDEELGTIIDEYINSSTSGFFTYRNLLYAIRSKAQQENRFEKEPHTEYSNIELTIADDLRVSRLVWQRVVTGQLFPYFGNDQFINPHSQDQVFGVNNQ